MQKIGFTTPCLKTVRSEKDDFKIYRDSENIIWCYAFSGQGFKHGPSIGMNVVDLVKKFSLSSNTTSHYRPRL